MIVRDSLVRAAFEAMPPAKADEFAAYVGHPGFDRRWLNRVAPAKLPEITIDRPTRRSRAKRKATRERPIAPQLILL